MSSTVLRRRSRTNEVLMWAWQCKSVGGFNSEKSRRSSLENATVFLQSAVLVVGQMIVYEFNDQSLANSTELEC